MQMGDAGEHGKIPVAKRCNRDDRHPGLHYDSRKGYWGDSVHSDRSQPRLQFADLDWQDRFTANPDAAAFYYAYEVGEDKLLTVGPLGVVHLNKEQYPRLVEQLRKWADGLEKYMKFYEEKDDA